MTTPGNAAGLPLVLGTPEQFATVNRFLTDVGYTATGVSERTGVPAIYLFTQLSDGRTTGTSMADPLDAVIRLFMDVEGVDGSTLRRFLPASVVGAFRELGLLVASSTGTDWWRASVLLYPAGTHVDLGRGSPEMYVVSDLNVDVEPAQAITLAPDVVYPAITLNTGAFLTFLPRRPCQHFLEMCGGTGIAALLSSRLAQRAWTADVSMRASHYAEFNVRLNGLSNVVVACGDLYQPVQDLTFDRVVAHPPYVPAFQQRLLFRDGGDDGEHITRRVVAGLPNHLRPGGRFYCTCRATDRKGATLEQRVRAWLGEREGDFDVCVITLKEQDVREHYADVLEGRRTDVEEIQARMALFRQLEAERFVHGTIVIQRIAGARAPFTERRDVGAVASSAAVEWLLDWETLIRELGGDAWLLEARPRVGERSGLEIKQRRQAGQWRATGCTADTDWPFLLGVECPLWAATLLDQCDGRRPLRDHLGLLRTKGALPAEGAEATFLDGVRVLASAGILEFERHPLPALRSGAPPPPVA
jgi:methylase of polypeptide subunit release factors